MYTYTELSLFRRAFPVRRSFVQAERVACRVANEPRDPYALAVLAMRVLGAPVAAAAIRRSNPGIGQSFGSVRSSQFSDFLNLRQQAQF